MSADCCSTNRGGACPHCGMAGRAIEALTPKALLTSTALRRGVPAQPRYCANANCDVVYFGDDKVFTQQDVTVEVFTKTGNDSAPVCYCFAHTRASIRTEAIIAGHSSASREISELVRAGACACEVRNPKGSCCLGDVQRVEKESVARQEEVSSNGN